MGGEEAWRAAIGDDGAGDAAGGETGERGGEEGFDGFLGVRLRVGQDAAEGEARGCGDGFGQRNGGLRTLDAAASAAGITFDENGEGTRL